MHDNETCITELKQRIDAFSAARDWKKFHSPKNLSMAIAAEAAELMEHFLWCETTESATLVKDPEKRQDIADELADIMILALRFASVCGLDVSQAIVAKLTRNEQRYPVEQCRGKSTKYTELKPPSRYDRD